MRRVSGGKFNDDAWRTGTWIWSNARWTGFVKLRDNAAPSRACIHWGSQSGTWLGS